MLPRSRQYNNTGSGHTIRYRSLSWAAVTVINVTLAAGLAQGYRLVTILGHVTAGHVSQVTGWLVNNTQGHQGHINNGWLAHWVTVIGCHRHVNTVNNTIRHWPVTAIGYTIRLPGHYCWVTVITGSMVIGIGCQ